VTGFLGAAPALRRKTVAIGQTREMRAIEFLPV
jgi:hypothetical protein